jgi:pimeloyl-ACP methyl ester carboxylesterase
MANDNDKQKREKPIVETGFFENGLPYARIGNNTDYLINLEALTFENKPPSGFMIKRSVKSLRPLMDKYTIYFIGRKQNVPEDYTFTDMANDYADMIRKEFKKPVIIIGASTGGQIAHYLAADHPDVVQKLIIISAAYRVSERGAEIESRAAEYFKQGKYGKSISATLDLVFSSNITRGIAKLLTRLFGKFFIGDTKYPNDFLTEVKGDIEMNFKDRLSEIKAPTLILSGELDIEYTPELVRTTAEGIPNSKLIFYKGIGHGLAAKWKLIQKDIIQFIEK